jgi:tripartite-type tricarboxylate transporter receptor subunit TctC
VLPDGDKTMLDSFTWRCAATLALAVLAPLTSQAQSYANKMITMVVPYPAGGPSDFITRQLQPELSKQLGQQILVDNVGGVGGALGIQKVLQAPADGHTMVMASPMELILSPLGMSAVKHKPEDLRLAGLLVKTTMILLGRKDLPANTVDELVADAKKPGAKELSFGSVGAGSMYHLVAESFSKATGVKMLHVPYKGAAPLVTDLMGGQIDVVFMPLAGNVGQLIKEGKVKAYGITAKQPHPQFPQLPLLTASKGLDALEFDLWAGVQVPKSTPDAVVAQINKAIAQSLGNADIRKAYESTGNEVAKPMTPGELDKLYTAEIARYQAIAKSVNLQPQ